MRYCPKCEEEYRDDALECPDDKVPTLDEAAFARHLAEAGRQPADGPEFSSAGQADDAFQADLLSTELSAADIPVVVRQSRPGLVETLTVPAGSYYELHVPTALVPKARALIDAAKTRLVGEAAQAEKAAEDEERESEGAAPR